MDSSSRATWQRVAPTVRAAASLALSATLIGGTAATALHAEEWRALVGAESGRRAYEAIAFLPNELWVHVGDTIRWTFPTHERHTLTFLRPGQTRPPGFGPIFGVVVGCPGTTPDGSAFDNSSCVSTGLLMLDDNQTAVDAPSYSVAFPSTGNFKFVCLIHADMTGVVHVLDASATLPHDQDFYDRQAARGAAALLEEASHARVRAPDGGDASGSVAAGIGAVVTMTGAGAQTASLMRFARKVVVVRVGDTVEWANLDPSINHTVTFGAEPADPRVASGVVPTPDGARQAVINSTSDNVSSGFLTPAPQDRPNLAQSAPGVTRFRVTFNAPGTYEYICAIHDELGMKGTVIVE
jgi:plastocyanin